MIKLPSSKVNKRGVIASCSLCYNFDSLRGECSISHMKKEVYDIDSPLECQSKGDYIRDFLVIPSVYNYYLPDQPLPPSFEPDVSRVAKDEAGKPLVVRTNRGLERAIPAYEGLEMKVDTFLQSVLKEHCFQGQRELIFQLGVSIAREVTAKAGVELIVLAHEENSEGIPNAIEKYRLDQSVRKSFNI